MVVLQFLKDNQLFLNYTKFVFLLRSVVFLSQIVYSEGVEVYPKKTMVVKNWPRPLAPTHIRFFLGLSGYYRRFVDGFASIAYPFNTLTQMSVKFKWSEACFDFIGG